MDRSIVPSTLLEQVTERVDRLLLRHAEQQRANALLQEQVANLTQERDSLKSRLAAARSRVDALLARLAPLPATHASGEPGDPA